MSVDIEAVKSIVLATIDATKPPHRAQISEICRLTHYDDARKEVQRVILRRLKFPTSYDSLEVLHTLILVDCCLSNASSEFVKFCAAQAQFVNRLVQYEAIGTPVARDIAGNARMLSKFFAEYLQRSKPRPAVSAPEAPKVIPFPNPLTKGETQKKITAPAWLMPKLITTDPFPEKEMVKSSIQEVHSDTAFPPSPLLLPENNVAMMTFQRGSEGLDALLKAVDELANPQSTVRRHQDDLVKALKCVRYCLIWGSAPFLAECREKRTIFNLLYNRHADPQVRGHAYEVFKFLSVFLSEEEEISRQPLMPQIATYHHDTKLIDESHDFSLMSHVDISKAVMQTRRTPFAMGPYADLWESSFLTKSGEKQVAIKFLRTLKGPPSTILTRNVVHELAEWRTLIHRNVSPFYGVYVKDMYFGLVWPLYPNGNVLDYVRAHPNSSPLRLLQGIADGVIYLHARGIIHGNIKCANVMVDDKRIPKLIDLTLFQVVNRFEDRKNYIAANLVSSLRWAAPEILIGDSPFASRSEKSDVYAFASTCFELIKLETPYHDLNDAQVMKHVAIKGRIPPRSSSLRGKRFPNDHLWELLTSCWSVRPRDRPNIVAVRRTLAEIYNHEGPVIIPKKTRFRWPVWVERT